MRLARHTWRLGTTRRTPGPDGPLEHAATNQTRTPHGRTFRALCGAGIYHRPGLFDPTSPRACPTCATRTRPTP